MSVNQFIVRASKVLLVFPLALSTFLSVEAVAQVACDSDGIEVAFLREKAGVLELKKKVKPKDIVGKNFKDQAIGIQSAGIHDTYYTNGKLTVDSLDPGRFPDHNLSVNGFDRIERNVWEVEFPRGMYEFSNKRDLQIDVTATVTGGHATHIIEGSSAVSLVVEEGKIKETWWGGSNSLRRLRGDLVFYYSDFFGLAMDGVHRATLDLCVNIRGNL